MIQKENRYRILQLFFDSPRRNFQLREISRILKVGLPSISNYVKELEREGFVRKEKRGVYNSYMASSSNAFKTYKRNDMLVRLKESGLIDFIADSTSPDAIVLFGSASRGEDAEESDVDLMVVAKEEGLDVRPFEKRLCRKISLHFEPKVRGIPSELLNNVINGIVVYGYLKVF